MRDIGLPGVLKTRRLGYDGKGQAVLENAADVERAWRELGAVPLLYEERIAFSARGVDHRRARAPSGEVADLSAERQRAPEGILRLTRAPYGPRRLAEARERLSRARARAISATSAYSPSSSSCSAGGSSPTRWRRACITPGHWTIEGAVTSQFENHLRAIMRSAAGLDPAARAMRPWSISSARMPPRKELLGLPRPAPARLCQGAAPGPQARPLHAWSRAPVASATAGHAACSPALAPQHPHPLRSSLQGEPCASMPRSAGVPAWSTASCTEKSRPTAHVP